MNNKTIDIGGSCYVEANRISVICPADIAFSKRNIKFLQQFEVTDATCGQKTRSVIFTQESHAYKSSLTPETIAGLIETDPED